MIFRLNWTTTLCYLDSEMDSNIGHGVTIEDILEQARGYVLVTKPTGQRDISDLSQPQLYLNNNKFTGCLPPDSRLVCTEHQERNKVFPNHFMNGNNIANKVENATKRFAALCRDTVGCRSVDILTSSCYVNNVMPNEIIPGHSETINLSWRMCDPCN